MPHPPALFVWTTLGAVLLAGAASAPPEPQQDEVGVRPASRQNAVTAYPSGYSARWMEDSDFVYGPPALDFDLKAYFAQNAPQLSSRAEFIAHWCGYFSINPKVMLTVIDLRSGLLSRPEAGASMVDPLAKLVPGGGFDEQIKQALVTLYDDFYAYREANARVAAAQPGGAGMNAATFALVNLFRADAALPVFAAQVDAARTSFQGRFRTLFPPARAVRAPEGIAVATPAGLMQLPWRAGVFWLFNGVHTNTGSDPGVMSSIDFTRSWGLRWDDDTSNDYVVAALDGTVNVFSSCSVRVTSPSGWGTNYYHLANILVASGNRVLKNQRLAVYANTLSQALCQGGRSTGPHVHFSLLNNGMFVEISDANFSSYIVHAGRFSYDSDRNYMWLQDSSSQRYYSHSDLISTPPTPPTPFTDDPLTTASWIKAVHIEELRTGVDAVRARCGLASYPWTDAALSVGVTTVKAAHIQQLRAALNSVYDAMGLTRPTYDDTALAAGSSTVKTVHITQIRAALLAVE